MSPKAPANDLADYRLDQLEADMATVKTALADLPQLRAEVARISERPRTWVDTAKNVAQLVVAGAAALALLKPLVAPAQAAPQPDPEAIARRAAEAAVEALARQQSQPGPVRPAKFSTPSAP